jgi:clan AA aspartic protease
VISGIVTDRYATVSLTFLLVNGSTFPIEFVIDTGFTDYLCLPPEAVNLLRLSFLYNLPVNLADNSTVSVAVHQATVFWDSVERDIRVLAMIHEFLKVRSHFWL